jgi:O-antigen ligase/Mrp family chromosome partitioning ATPase
MTRTVHVARCTAAQPPKSRFHSGGAGLLSRVNGQIAALWRGRWLVVLVMLSTVVVAFVAAQRADVTYTARAALSAASAQTPETFRMRTPNEDAGLAKTYATYFNTAAFQQYLRAKVGVPADVTSFGARVEGENPLLFVVATADSPDSARTAAEVLAKAFVEEVRRLVADRRDRTVAELEKGLQAGWGDLIVPDDQTEADAALRVQERIDAMNSDSGGLLALVQPDAGVTTNAPDLADELLKALIGGLLLGCAAVVVRAHVSRRMTTAQDVHEKTGLPVLVVDPDTAAPWASAADLTAGVGPGRSVVAVAAVSGNSAWPAASTIARWYAGRGIRAVIIRADLRRDGEHTDTRPGVADYLRARKPVGIDDLIVDERGVLVIGAGTRSGDPFPLFDRVRFTRLVDEARVLADMVIIESPAVRSHPEAHIVCGVADRTLLVVERDRTNADDATAAIQSLERAETQVSGAVLTGTAQQRLRIPRSARGRTAGLLVAAAVLVGIAVLTVVAPSAPGGVGGLTAVAASGYVAVHLGLRDPRWAYVFLLTTLFLRLALPNVLPVDPFLVAFAGLVLSSAIWMLADRARRPVLGVVELAMVLYLLWNVQSAVMPHEYAPLLYPLTGEALSLYRYVLVGTVIPFTAYLLSRVLFERLSAVRNILRVILLFSAYSAIVSILEFTGPSSLIWPRYIVDAPNWAGRANGVFNQPGVNGLVMITGFTIALMLAAERGTRRYLRFLYAMIAMGCTAGIYLTHTRAIYLAFVVIIALGMIFAKGYRSSFGATFAVLVAGVTLNWSEFTSADRSAGGVASTNEIYDRLNAAATAIWAFWEKPWFGWGLGRFVAINAFHHQQWSPESPWIRGLGVASHFNELGILAELGIIGLLLWLAVLALLMWKLTVSFRALPVDGITGRPLALTAIMAFVTLLVLGCFSDLRLFDYPTAMVFGMIGMAIGAGDRARGVGKGRIDAMNKSTGAASRLPTG